MKAQPGPIVSGRYFFPKAALLWVKWIPAWAVMSRNVIFWACAGKATKIDRRTRSLRIIWSFLGRQQWFSFEQSSIQPYFRAPVAEPTRARESLAARCYLRDEAGGTGQ